MTALFSRKETDEEKISIFDFPICIACKMYIHSRDEFTCSCFNNCFNRLVE